MNFILNKKDKIDKVEILQNYIGSIKSILIMIQYNKTKSEFELKINENIDESKNYIIKKLSSSSDENENIKIYFNPENDDYISYKIGNKLFYNDIRYYGGIQCFIPIFKIIKYLIEEFKTVPQKIVNLNKNIIEIIKTIINIICYNKKNYLNFEDTFIPLLGALAEINHILPLSSQKELYNNHIFSTLYIIINCFCFPLVLKKSYIMITGLDDMNKLNLNIDDLIIDINSLDINCFHWYALILFNYIEFILLVYNDFGKVPKIIIEQLLKMKKVSEKKYDVNIETIFVNLLIGILNYICDIKNDENNIFKGYEKINNLSDFLEKKYNFLDNNQINNQYFIPLLITYFNLIDFDIISIKENIQIKKEDIIKLEEKTNSLSSSNKINDNNIHDINNNNADINHDFKSKFKQLFESLKIIFKKPNYIDNQTKLTINKALKGYIKQI